MIKKYVLTEKYSQTFRSEWGIEYIDTIAVIPVNIWSQFLNHRHFDYVFFDSRIFSNISQKKHLFQNIISKSLRFENVSKCKDFDLNTFCLHFTY
jgi:hypothetical protein